MNFDNSDWIKMRLVNNIVYDKVNKVCPQFGVGFEREQLVNICFTKQSRSPGGSDQNAWSE